MSADPKCPQCDSKNTYFDGNLWNCPDCGKEWNPDAETSQSAESLGYKDAFGNELVEGDSVTVIKELKVKGASSAVKVGTKVKNIRLGDFGNDHDISCKIPGIGSMYLKSEYVKKA